MPFASRIPWVVRRNIRWCQNAIEFCKLNFRSRLECFHESLLACLVRQIQNMHANVWNLIGITCAECGDYLSRMVRHDAVTKLHQYSTWYKLTDGLHAINVVLLCPRLDGWKT